MEANGRHGGEIEEKNRFPTPTTTMIQLTNACKNSTLMRVELESLAPVLWAWTIKDALWFSEETRETFYSFPSTVSNSGKEKNRESFFRSHQHSVWKSQKISHFFKVTSTVDSNVDFWCKYSKTFWVIFKHCDPTANPKKGVPKSDEKEKVMHIFVSCSHGRIKVSQSALWSERPKKSLIVLFWWINKSFQGQRLRGLHPDFSTLFINELKTYQSWRYRRSGVNLFASHSQNLWWTRKVRTEIILLGRLVGTWGFSSSILIEYVGKLCCIR